MPIGLSARWLSALPFAAVGTACIIAGGMVAAVAAAVSPSFERGMWVAAYLVLVAGVAQFAGGVGQALLAPSPPSRRLVAVEFIAWNGGNVAVLAGALLEVVPIVDVGGALLVVALVLLIVGVRGAGGHAGWWLHLYRLLIAVVLVSLPIGLLLARA